MAIALSWPAGVEASPPDGDVHARAARYEAAFVAAGARHGVDPRVLWTIGYLETRFRRGLVSPAGAAGLMQFMPGTASRFGVRNRFDPLESIDGAARYVGVLGEMFGGRVELILAGYNAGEGAVVAYRDGRPLKLPNGRVINPRGVRTGGIPPYAETRGYVAAGTRLYAALVRAGHLSAAAPLPHGADAPGEPSRGDPAERAPRPVGARSLSFFVDPARPAVPLPGEEEVADACAVVVTGSRSSEGAETGSIRFY